MTRGLSSAKVHRGWFSRFAAQIAHAAGRPWSFILALGLVLVWVVSGPFFHYSDTWQLVINTGTTVVTFLMVFLIQNTQNRDSLAMHLKLDELIRATEGAHTALMELEELTDRELDEIRKAYSRLASSGRDNIREGSQDTGAPEVEIFSTRPHQP